MRVRNSIILAALAVVIAAAPAHAEYRWCDTAISMADIPLTTGQPGSRRGRLSVHRLHDLRSAGGLGDGRVPTGRANWCRGLATEWKVDDSDKKKWRFTLRQGVKFHDGSDFNADAVIWNLDKVLNDKAPQFDKRQSAQVKTRLPSVASYAKIDDSTGRNHHQDRRLVLPLSDAVVSGLKPGAI